MTVSDQVASVALTGAVDLTCAMRDGETPETVRTAAQRVLDAVAGDPIAALCITAALVRTDLPIDRWWARGLDGLGSGLGNLTAASDVVPCRGTRAAARKHRVNGEDPNACPYGCAKEERDYNRVMTRARRARNRDTAA